MQEWAMAFGNAFRQFCRVLRLLALPFLGQITLASATDIHLAPNGNDTRSGSSRELAVATLGRAFDLALSDPRRRTEPMRILVGPGVYLGQSVVLDGGRLGYDVTVLGMAADPKDFPVFRGDGELVTWLTVQSDRGHRTGLTIQALVVEEYATAISLEGHRDGKERFNAGTTIRRNVFRNIGSIALKRDQLSTAAIRFVNSRDNVVENNYFRTIRNRKEKECGALHALYLAHFSSGNKIHDNTFDNTCGSVVKFRDRSNDNRVEDNRFIRIDHVPAVEEWFCDKDARKDCTKRLGECPSTGNVQRRNSQTESPNSDLVSVVGGRNPRDWCTKEDFSRERVQSN